MSAGRKAAIINRKLIPVWAFALVLSVISGLFFADAHSDATDAPATAGTPVSASDAAAGIDVEKYVSLDGGGSWADADDPTGPEAVEGADVWFRFVVTNTGELTLTDLTLTDSDFAVPAGGIPSELAPGASYEIVIGPYPAALGQHADTATATGRAAGTAPTLPAFPNTGEGSQYVFTFTNGSVIVGSNQPGEAGYTGDKNQADIGLSANAHVSCSDDFPGGWGEKGAPVEGADPYPLASYYIAKFKDGKIDKTCGTPTTDTTVSDTDDAHYVVPIPQPGIDVEKYVSLDGGGSWADADDPTGPEAVEGADVWFRFVVTNTGELTLTDLTLTDSDFAVPAGGIPSELAPGASYEIVIGPYPAALGQHADTATATGRAAGTAPTLPAFPNTGEGSQYVFTFTNGSVIVGSNQPGEAGYTGDKNQADIGLSANAHVSCSDDFPGGWGEKGAPVEGADPYPLASYYIAKFKDGKIDKTCGTPTTDTTVSDTDDAHYVVPIPQPGIDVEKYVSLDGGGSWADADDPTGPEAVEGADVWFRFVVTNTGELTLTDLTLTDSDFAVPAGGIPSELAPGASYEIVIGPYPAALGQHADTATATGRAAGTAPTLPAFPNTGEGSQYVFTFTNGSVIVGSNQPGEAGYTGDKNQADIGLSANAHVSCSDDFPGGWGEKGAPVEGADPYPLASYYIAKFKDGKIDKTCGTPTTDTTVSDTDDAHYVVPIPQPGIDVEKYVSLDGGGSWADADDPTGPEAVEGADVWFRFVVTNTGELTLTDLTLTDSDFAVPAGGIPSELAPGASYEIVIGPYPAALGQHADTATATGRAAGTAPTLPAFPNTGEGSQYVFTFTNGSVIVGSNQPGEAGYTGDKNQADIGLSANAHVSCSDDFPGGWGEKGAPVEGADPYPLASYYIAKFKDGKIDKTCGTPTTDTTVSDTDDAHYVGREPAPNIDVEKYVSVNGTDWFDADDPTGPEALVGADVWFRFLGSNPGEIDLFDISLTDTDFTIPANQVPADLAAGASFTVEIGPFPAQQGQHTNTATLQGTVPGEGTPHAFTGYKNQYTFVFADGSLIEGSTDRGDAYVGLSEPIHVSCSDRFGFEDGDPTNDGWGEKNAPVEGHDPYPIVSFFITNYDQNGSIKKTCGWGEPIKPPQTLTDSDPAHYLGLEPASLGDFVWLDLDADGIQDGGEAGFPGIEVNLSDGTGRIASTLTDANGWYGFDQLFPGDYTVEFSVPAGYGLSPMDQGGDDAADSDADPASGRTGPITLDAGEYDRTNDAGLYSLLAEIDVEKATRAVADESTTPGPWFDADDPTGPFIPAGDPVEWMYEVTNIGDAPLHDVVLTDSDPALVLDFQGDPNGNGLLDSGETWTYYGIGIALAGQYRNLATVTALSPIDQTVRDEDPSHYFGWYAAIDIEKATNGEDADDPTGPEIIFGDPVLWTYVVTNNSNVTLIDVAVSDDLLGPIACPATALAPGAAMTCSASGTAEVGQYENLGTAVGTPIDDAGAALGAPVADDDPSHYYGLALASLGDLVWFDADGDGIQDGGEPGIANATVNLLDAAGNLLDTTGTDGTGRYEFAGLRPGTEYAVEFIAPAGYAFTLQDQGDDALDSDPDPASGRTIAIVLDPGEHDPDWDAGFVKLLVSIDVEKATNGADADYANSPDVPYLPVGADVTWTYIVRNTGGTPLSGISLGDDLLGPIACPQTSLVPGAWMECAPMFGTASDGPYENIATATGYGPLGDEATDTDPSHYFGYLTGIDLEKYVNGDDADLPTGPYVMVGEPVTWTFDVTNTGNVDLADVMIDDPMLGFRCDIGLLPAGATDSSCSAPGIAEPGQHANTAVALGIPIDGNGDPLGGPIDDSDPAHYYGWEAAIDIEKATNGEDADDPTGPVIIVGDPVEWTYVVTSNSNVALTGVSVMDDVLGPIACPASMLLPGESMTCTATGTATAGQYENLGTAAGTPVDDRGVPLGGEVRDDDPSHYYGLALAALGDKVWLDTNADGIQGDPALEPGLSGITVELLQGGVVINTTTTNTLGGYGFADLIPGDYRVRFLAPAGFQFSPLNATSFPLDSDANPTTGETTTITLGEGQSDPTWDAGLYEPARVGDRVWLDTNANGIQDPGEPSLPGIAITLWQGAVAIDTTTTDAAGEYWFEDLIPGEYVIEFLAPAGLVFSPQDQGSNDALDSDADATGITDAFILISGQEDPTRDAGLYEPAAVGDFVFEDLNADGFQDSGEPGVPGVLVTLTAADGSIRTALTDDTGRYWFDGLIPGEYTITFTPPAPGWLFTAQDEGTDDTVDSDPDPATGTTAPFILASGDRDETRDAGLYLPASLGDRVWLDRNGDGIQDAGEPGIAGITVTLLDGSGVVLDSDVTDNFGGYGFSDLVPGEYAVEFVAPQGFVFSPQDEGSNDAADSDAAPATGRTVSTTLISGEIDPTWDAGLYEPARVGDFVWLDTNANGIQDPGEPGLPGIAITLWLDGVPIDTTTTDAAGEYWFEGLVPGEYTIEFLAPAGFEFSPQDQGSNDAADSDADAFGVTAPFMLVSGQSDPTRDAGLYEPARVGDFVWHDLNADGIQDPGEPGLAGIAITLWLDGVPIDTTTTDAAGEYWFEGLVPGEYTIEFLAPAGFEFSPQVQGSNDAADSDADAFGVTAPFMLVSGQSDPTRDAGLYEPARVGDFVWHDLNGDGIQDPAEPGLAGIIVTLLPASGPSVITPTGPDGYYEFTDLTPGDYTINFALPSPVWVFSPLDEGSNDDVDSDADVSGTTAPFTLISGQDDETRDAGMYMPASLGDWVWNDRNANGIQDNGDTGIEGVDVRLLDAAGTTVATDVTDAIGGYSFDGLTPGDYRLEFTALAGFAFSPQDQGSNDAADSDADAAGATTVITLASGQNDPTWDAGLYSTNAAIDISKNEEGRDTTAPIVRGGDTTFTITVRNVGDVDLFDVTIIDPRVPACDGFFPALPVGASESYPCDAVGLQANFSDPAGDYFENIADVTAIAAGSGQIVSDSDDVLVPLLIPAIDIEKATRTAAEESTPPGPWFDADDPTGPMILAGSVVDWQYVVTNTGDTDLSGVGVVDDILGAISCPTDALAPGESMTCTASGIATAGQYANVGEVFGASPTGEIVTDDDPSHYFGVAASIDIEKATNGEDADAPTGPMIPAGSTVTWTYMVTNTGNVPLASVTVIDDQGVVPVFVGGDVDNNGLLDVNEIWIFEATGSAVPGQYANVGAASGVPPVGPPVDDSDPSHYFGVAASIDIEKATNGEDADAPTGPMIPAGEPVVWTYLVANTGNVPLLAVTVVDDMLGQIACPTDVLLPGESMTCVASGQATPGQYENTGTATGMPPVGPPVDDDDPSHYFGVAASIDIEKATNGEDADAPTGPMVPAGSTVTWTYLVTNTGNVPLASVTVIDDQGVVPVFVGGDVDNNGLLDVNEIWSFEAMGSAIAGQYANVGAASGVPPVGPPVDDSDPSHYFGVDASIDIEKATNGHDADAAPGPMIPAGEPVVWTYLVANTGNVPLLAVTVVDDMLGQIACPTDVLLPGESMTCVASGQATPGQYENTGTATGMPPVGPPVDDDDPSHYFGMDPGIHIEKATNGSDADDAFGPGVPWIVPGAPVLWTYVVTNTGNVPLDSVTVIDDQLGPIAGPAFGDVNNDGRLDVTETWIYEAFGTADDLYATPFTVVPGNCSLEFGGIFPTYENMGVAIGETGFGPIEAFDWSHYCNPPAPGIEIEKWTNGADADDPNGPDVPVLSPGDTVTWTYAVTNIGTLPFFFPEVTVTDSTAGVVPVFDPASDVGGDGMLSPGEMWVYVAQGLVLDLPATPPGTGISIVDGCFTETEFGQPGTRATYENVGTVIVPGDSDEDVSHYCNPTPEVVIEKATNGADADDPNGPDVPVLSPGDTVTWTYAVTNIGVVSIPLSDIVVTDDQPGVVPVFDPASDVGGDGMLSPGEMWTYTATGTVADLPAAGGLGFTIVDGCSINGEIGGPGTRATYENVGTVIIPGFEDSDQSHYCNPTPEVVIEKATNGADADDPNGPDVPVLSPGDTVTWTYAVTNIGVVSIPLSDIVVTDDQPGVVPVFDPASDVGGDGMLSPGEMWVYVAQGLVLDLPATPPGTGISIVDGCFTETEFGQPGTRATYENVGTVIVPGDSDEDVSHYCNPTPEVVIEKATNGADADDPNGPDVPVLSPGDTVTWTYAVTNIGVVSIPLSDIVVTDDQPGVVPVFDPASDVGGDGMLSPGEMWTYTATGTVADLPAAGGLGFTIVDGCSINGEIGGPGTRATYENVGTVIIPGFEDSDQSHYCNPTPEVVIEKATNGADADDPNGPDVPVLSPGDTVTWTYAVTNIGVVSIPLSDIVVTDDQPGVVPVFDPASDVGGDGMLSPGEMWVYVAQGLVLDLPATPPGTGISIVDGCFTETEFGQPGTRATYENVGTVIVPGDSDEDVSHYCNPTPEVVIEKATNGADADDPNGPDVPVLSPGDTVTWTYAVTNIGVVSIPLSDIVVTDDQPGVVPVFDPASDVGGDGMLSPGEMWTYTATGTVADLPAAGGLGFTIVDGCSINGEIGGPGTRATYENVGTVIVPGDSDEDVSHYCNPTPEVVIEKATNGADADDPNGPDVPVLSPGDTVTWTYAVTNIGVVSIPLSDIVVTDDQPGVVPVFDPASDVGGDGMLSPGEMWTYTATGTVADLPAAGGLGFTIVDGCSINGEIGGPGTRATYENVGTVIIPGFEDSDQSHYCNPIPAIDIEKATRAAADESMPAGPWMDADTPTGPVVLAGAAIEWRYTVTNTGETVLTDVAVYDDMLGGLPPQGEPVCVIGTLLPGESAECFEIGGAIEGQYANLGVATGLSPTGETVTDEDPSHYLAVLPASVGDFVWDDLNADGIQDQDEPGIAGVLVMLIDAGGNLAGSAVTDSTGWYEIGGLPPADYSLVFTLPNPGFVFSPQDQGTDDTLDSDAEATGETAPFTLAAGQHDGTRDAGMYRLIDLQVSKTGIPDVVQPTGSFVYVITVNNFGPSDATDVVLLDLLPARLAGSDPVLPVPFDRFPPFDAIGEPAFEINAVVDTLGNPDERDPFQSVTVDAIRAPLGVTCAYHAEIGGVPVHGIRCDTAGLAAGASFQVEVDVTVNPFAVIRIWNRAWVYGNEYEANLDRTDPGSLCAMTPDFVKPDGERIIGGVGGCNFVKKNETIEAEIDLEIVKTADPLVVEPGDTITYTLDATNHGPSGALAPFIVDELPPLTTFVSASAGCAYDDASRTVECEIGPMVPGATASFQVVVTADPNASGTLYNEAIVENRDDREGAPQETDLTNNIDDAIVEVILPAIDLEVTKAADPTIVPQGAESVFTISVANRGPDPATGVVLTDTLPAGLTFVSAATAKGTFDDIALAWTVGDLAVDEMALLTLTVTVDEVATFTNAVEVTAADQDDIDSVPGDGQGDDYAEATVAAFSVLADKSIGDTVYRDTDGDGFQDAGELGIAGAVVTLTGPVGTTAAVTDADGRYLFSALPEGDYTVTVDTGSVPEGLALTTAGEFAVTLGESYFDADFGFAESLPKTGMEADRIALLGGLLLLAGAFALGATRRRAGQK